MIGFIAGEGYTMFEFWPVFGSDNGIPKWAQLNTSIELPEKAWGEFGVAFSSGKKWRDFTIWISFGYSQYPRDFDSFKRWVKKAV